MIDYYYVLGVSTNATGKEIKTAYRKLSKKFHPDLNDGDEFFKNRFQEIQNAYETLIDPVLKKQYDDRLNNVSDSSRQERSTNSKAYSTKKEPDPAPKHTSNNPKKTIGIDVKYAMLIALLLGVATLIYFFINYDFSGWAKWGFIIAALLIGRVYVFSLSREYQIISFVLAGVLLFFSSTTVFALGLTVLSVYYVSRLMFSKFPMNKKLIIFIPIGSYLMFLLFIFSFNDLYKQYDNNVSNNYSNQSAKQQLSHGASRINRTAYISAKPFANVRTGTSTQSSVITTLINGEEIFLLEQDQATNWYKVKYRNNNYGYVSNMVVSFNKLTNSKSQGDLSVERDGEKSNSDLEISNNANSIMENRRVRIHKNYSKGYGYERILDFGKLDVELGTLFNEEFKVQATNAVFERLGFKQIKNSLNFKYQYLESELTQGDIYERINVEKAKTILTSPTEKDPSAGGRAAFDNTPIELIKGTWSVSGENATYEFRSKGKGLYVYASGVKENFSWVVETKIQGGVKVPKGVIIDMDNDDTQWDWQIISRDFSQMTMHNSAREVTRTLHKIR